jgi:hypothetical protein
MDHIGTVLKVIGFVAVLSLAGLYGPDALGTVTYYYAAMPKNGKLDIFDNQPQTEVCAYSLFPHAGYRPRWYAVSDRVRTIG